MAEAKISAIDPGLTRRRALLGGTAEGPATLPAVQAGPAIVRRYAAPAKPKDLENHILYRRENEFSGWPHVRGFWDFGDGEIVQNFGSVPTDYASAGAISHDTQTGLDRSKERLMSTRSKDYGRTWSEPTPGLFANVARGAENAKTIGDLGPIDFLDRNVILSTGGAGFGTAQGRTGVRISRDRGLTWTPNIPVPLDGLNSLSGINSTTVRPDGTVLLFLMEVTADENRHPLVYALPPRGTDFHFMSMITNVRDSKGATDGDYAKEFSRPGSVRFGGHRWFYARGYLLPSGRILCVLRCSATRWG
ncbi:MAG: hypothetical protein WDN24_19865 [Sphingomonas sp.]